MNLQELVKQLVIKTPSKIVLLVIDGLGGLPGKEGKTELEVANISHLNELANKSICGLTEPIGPGITPGSGSAHLALFGYDPLKYLLGRGILSALGIGFELQSNDLAFRGNFATIDESGKISDRRAGRISTKQNEKLSKMLAEEIKLKDIEIFVKPEKEHRFVLILRGPNLSARLTDSDPQRIGYEPLEVKPLSKEAFSSAQLVNSFIYMAKEKLKNSSPANMILLRGADKYTLYPNFEEIYKLKSAAIVTYPMYKGLAKLLGMEILKTGETIEDEFKTLKDNFNEYDFFYLHIKKTDSAGEDGDFERKVKALEEIDNLLPKVLDLNPDCLVITGDHSTPAVCKGHSWHSVPILIYSVNCRSDSVYKFSEQECLYGGLGKISALSVIPLALANANKLTKFGA